MTARFLLLVVTALTGTAACAAPLTNTAAHIGERRWVSRNLYLCTEPVEMIVLERSPCASGKGHSFMVLRAAEAKGKTWYVVRMDSGGERWIEEMDLALRTDDAESHAKKVSDSAQCDRKGGITVGMTREQVYVSCWGKPRSINKTITAGGTHEQLVYPGYNYVYLENGVVRSIQTH